MTREVQLKDFGKVLKEFSNKTILEQKQATIEGIIDSVNILTSNSPVDTGEYANSWDFSVEEKSIILGNYAPHAPVIEFGARPFTPPLKPLLQWAKRVLQDSSQPPDYSDNVWALAIYTRNKIKQYGMKPKNVLMKSLPGIVENIKKRFNRL